MEKFSLSLDTDLKRENHLDENFVFESLSAVLPEGVREMVYLAKSVYILMTKQYFINRLFVRCYTIILD